MSSSSVLFVINRIKSATPYSPLVVFYDSTRPWLLDAFFANTVIGEQEIKAREGLIGVFDNTMDLSAVKRMLEKAVVPQEICPPEVSDTPDLGEQGNELE